MDPRGIEPASVTITKFRPDPFSRSLIIVSTYDVFHGSPLPARGGPVRAARHRPRLRPPPARGWLCQFLRALVHFVWSRDSRLRQQDSFAQELESCAAEHLALEHLDPVDMTLHDAGVPGQCEARGDGVEVAFEVLGEAPEAGQFGGGGSRFDPGRATGRPGGERPCARRSARARQVPSARGNWPGRL